APDAVMAIREEIIPNATIVTPNLMEAAVLSDTGLARNEMGMEIQAREILTFGPKHVLIKGGHGEGVESVDLLVGEREVIRLSSPRTKTSNTHGTGCTLSAAIAAGLAKGQGLREAVEAAKAYVTAAIAHADQLKVGSGHGPLNHFYAFWRKP
ncbi:MAG: bifunctional hydroxymethylpyrimidine kinase/phosphomethylpyrimidine kinase, partial [Pseudolabrys sp.]|nr:bifunctional hydroxymethylpyrimidine kinase/phosphomethylpyrimidine kinase [Pseudolabrys sp.]